MPNNRLQPSANEIIDNLKVLQLNTLDVRLMSSSLIRLEFFFFFVLCKRDFEGKSNT